MLRKIRIILSALFFIGISFLFVDFTGVAHVWLGWMAKIQFLPAVLALNFLVVILLVLLTFLFGRIYCSVICPLGVMQDLIARIGRKVKKNRYAFSPAKQLLRYCVLGVFILAVLLGATSFVSLIAPYSMFGRIATSLLQPLWMLGNNVLANLAEKADSYAFYGVDVWVRSLPVLIVSVVSFAAVAILAYRNGRTYCNTICPVGTVLGFISRFSLFKIQIDQEKCNGCGLCARNCKAACINAKQHVVDYSRCVDCMNCIGKCHKGAISYSFRKPTTVLSESVDAQDASSAKNKSDKPNTDSINRREFISTSAIALGSFAIAAQAKKVDGGLAVIEDKQKPLRKTPLVPAGAVSLKNLQQRCTGCQLCISKCPNDVLRPSSDIMHLLQPEMSYERGFCRPECTACADVCPAGAINPISKEQKSSTQIGHAVILRDNCVAVNTDDGCGLCSRKCPAGAIMMVEMTHEGKTVYGPVVNEEACVGCGKCENLCPARPFAAIYVEGHEIHKEI